METINKTFSNTEKLSQDLENLITQNDNEDNYSDFEIICYSSNQNQFSFNCHKSILSSRSQYFKSMFHSKMKEYQENKIIFQDVSKEAFSIVLQYLYTGKCNLNLENAVEILIFSSKYLIEELTSFASDFIKENFQIEILSDILKISETMNIKDLNDFCYQFISEHFNSLLKIKFFEELEEYHLERILSSEQLFPNEFDIFQTIIKWGKHKLHIQKEKLNIIEREELKSKISKLINKIRFIEFSKKEIKQVSKMNIIEDEVLKKVFKLKKIQNSNFEEFDKLLLEYQEEYKKSNSLFFNLRFYLNSDIIKDISIFRLIRSWIQDKKFFTKMKLRFSAKKDGFSSKEFHKVCDDKGPTLIIVKSAKGYIMGGFTKVGFKSQNPGHVKDDSSFIFTIKNPKNSPPQKFPIIEERNERAIYSNNDYGPYFGDFGYYGDLCVYSTLDNGRSNLGRVYQLPDGYTYETNEARTFLAGEYVGWKIEDLEAYF
ncbi:pep-cterm sorting domain-containing protein [Anaeramoeba ignava]|uniref:Pep-cterm sorting domain-containing protein n=1 Tax=Anaeramoeba ignava TaxID=1746090 RepID=A0A9Q0LD05_ANAIG|nr:pep-cterm sorting domain-containing protein [Anaeramoeba ignava]